MNLFVDPVSWTAWKVAFFASLVVSGLLARPILNLLIRFRSRQTVSQHAPENHQAKQGTPTMGGIMILVGALAGLVAVVFQTFGNLSDAERTLWNRHLGAGVWVLLGLGLVGFVDDGVIPRVYPGKRGLGWIPKLAMQTVIAGAAGYTLYPNHGVLIALSAFLILFFCNAYNFSDGLDGLAGSLYLALIPGFVLLVALERAQGPVVPSSPMIAVMVAVMGGVIPFLFLNSPPAKVFMGDVGSLPIGGVLGLTVATLLWPSGYALDPARNIAQLWLPLTVLSLPMICELVPVPIQIFSVKVFRRKVFPYTPIHHAFEKAGWPETRVVWMFALIQLICSLVAVGLVAG